MADWASSNGALASAFLYVDFSLRLYVSSSLYARVCVCLVCMSASLFVNFPLRQLLSASLYVYFSLRLLLSTPLRLYFPLRVYVCLSNTPFVCLFESALQVRFGP